MKYKKVLTTLVLALALVGAFTVISSAADGLQEISAYLNSNITVKMDGEVQTLLNANGTRVYPISYKGTTYLPVRAVAEMVGLDVDWDQATQTVLLGKQPSGVDLIENYNIYHRLVADTTFGGQVTTAENKTEDIGGITKNHWIYLNCVWWGVNEVSYNLLGKHDTLTFSYYSKEDCYLWIRGDDGALLGKYAITGGAVPKTVTVPLFKTNELKFGVSPTSVWEEHGSTTPQIRIFDAYLDAEG